MRSVIILTTGCILLAIFYAVQPAGSCSTAKATGSSERDSDVPELADLADGEVDASEAIQRLIDSGPGDLRLPRGRFRLTRPLEIDLDRTGFTSLHGGGVATLVMAGGGPALRIVGTHFRSADPGGFEPKVWKRQRMPLVDGLGIVGDHPEACGIEAEGTMQLTVSRVHVRGVLHAIHLVKNNRNITISDCHLYENRGIGIFYDDVNLHQSNITGCHISYNHGGGIVSRAGNVRNIHVTGCDIESNMDPDHSPTANVLIDCTGSRYGTGEVAITGCTIQHNNPSPGSANIRILGGSLPAEEQKRVREGNVTITGNVLSDVKVNLHLRECRGVVVTGNTFWMGYEQNILVEESSNIVFGPNNLDRNPRYSYGNTSEANNGVVFRNCEDGTITGLHLTNVWREPAGLIIRSCRRMNITNSTILDCDNAGILLENVTHSRVSDCLVRDDRPGATSTSVKVVGGKGNQIVDNLLGGRPGSSAAEQQEP